MDKESGNHERKRSMERYRPGAMNGSQPQARLPSPDDNHRNNTNYRGNRGRGRGSRGNRGYRGNRGGGHWSSRDHDNRQNDDSNNYREGGYQRNRGGGHWNSRDYDDRQADEGGYHQRNRGNWGPPNSRYQDQDDRPEEESSNYQRNRGHWGPQNSRNQEQDGEIDELSNKMKTSSLEADDLRFKLLNKNRNENEGGFQGGKNRHQRLQGRGAKTNHLARPKKNTENFNPSHEPADIRIKVGDIGSKTFNDEILSRDVIAVGGLFGDRNDLSIYENLIKELKEADGDDKKLWQLWHGDSHVIADDKKNWKSTCPTFGMVINTIQDYFKMDIKATRLNWYRDSNEWKPFHHDAAAVKPDKAKTQNFTVAVSFGLEREAAFEHAKTKTVVSMPQPNGMIYAFSRDVNIIWRHGILQMPPEKFNEQGRISIIAWGWVEMTDE